VSYTKGHLPYVIHYYESFNSREEAIQREKFFKTIEGYKWLKENGIT
jgi:putative endonuclease